MRLITKRMGYEIAHPDMPRSAQITTLEEDEEMLEFINRNIGRVEESGG
jgi:precorrin-6B methylase 2